MSQSGIYHYPEGPSLQGTLTATPSSLTNLDHKGSPSTCSSPSPLASASCSSTPTAVKAASPATVYSDRLLYRVPAAPTATPRRQATSTTTMPIEFVRAHAKGTVRFRPFEDGLDEAAVRAIDDFQIYPFGDIEEYCRHIPYASGKKDFYEKTGRESFEVFQYVFKVPGDDKEYHVMWDYNVGLVRMTPFFKCCKYSKTTPAKMLGLNPGLREITHSITGGSIMAQGYWMPYTCAKAVCATFCYRIAGALIPIFGPDFPSDCLPPQSPEFGRMVIDKALVQDATADTERMRQITLKDSKSGIGKPLPYHQARHQSLELDLTGYGRYDRYGEYGQYDQYDQYDQYERYEQYDQYSRDGQMTHLPQRHRAADSRYSDADMDAHLPRPGYHAHHAQTHSDSLYEYHHGYKHHQQYERGPELAPLRYYTSHRGSLLPSPIEHEKLPPFSHIASLTPTHQPERHQLDRQQTDRVPTTLPPLIVRDGHHPQPHHFSLYSTSHPDPAASRVETLHPEPHRREDKRCFNANMSNMEVDAGAAVAVESHGYEDYTRYQVEESGAPHQANTNAHQTQTLSRTEDRTEGRQTHGPREPGEVDGHRFAPSSCYPSPPRLPRLVAVPYERQARCITDNDSRGHRKSVSMSSLPRPQRRRHQKQHHGHHYLQMASTRRRALKSETPSTSTYWNAKDADAAELLVHLRDDGQEEIEYEHEYDEYEERVQDSIHVRTSPQHQSLPLLHTQPQPQPQTQPQPQYQPQSRAQSQQPTNQFAARISSLLCDDTAPRKKRRGI